MSKLDQGTLATDQPAAKKGDVWTGFEWVSPERYEELRKVMDLPPIQAVAGEAPWRAEAIGTVEADHEGPRSSYLDAFDANPDMTRDELAAGGAPYWGGDLHRAELGCQPMPAAPPAAPQAPQAAPAGGVVPAPAPVAPVGAPVAAYGQPCRWPGGLLADTSPTRLGRIEEAVVYLLDAVDPQPERGGLVETPQRAAKAWEDWTCGYRMDPAAVLKVFEDGAQGCDEMVVVHDIPIYSHCEHHLAPIFGTATIGYLPNGKIVGLSKLSRLADVFARRLQVQERMTNQIAEAIMEHLGARGCGVVIKARHLCMESRGVKQAGTFTTTSSLLGAFRDNPQTRAEFFALAHRS